MLSFKKWKKLNENLCIPLGVGQPNKIANLHSKWDEGKACNKGMFGDAPDEGEGLGPKGPPMRGKKKPPMHPEPDEELGGAPDDLGDEGPMDDVPPEGEEGLEGPGDEEGLEGP